MRWYHDEELVADNGNENFTSLPRHQLWENGSLEIVNVKPKDTGEYMCEVVREAPLSTVRQYHAIEVLRKSRFSIYNMFMLSWWECFIIVFIHRR